MKWDFERIVDTYYKAVYRFVISMVRNSNDACDITQETFLKVRKYFKNFRGDSSVLTYIYRIAVNETKKFISKKRDFPERVFPSVYSLTTEDYLDLHDVLESLDREDYEIIYLQFFENMSETLIAFIRDIPEGTVKSRLFNAKRKLKEVMESGRKN